MGTKKTHGEEAAITVQVPQFLSVLIKRNADGPFCPTVIPTVFQPELLLKYLVIHTETSADFSHSPPQLPKRISNLPLRPQCFSSQL